MVTRRRLMADKCKGEVSQGGTQRVGEGTRTGLAELEFMKCDESGITMRLPEKGGTLAASLTSHSVKHTKLVTPGRLEKDSVAFRRD